MTTGRSDKATTKNGNGRQPDAEVQALWDQMEVDDNFLVGCLMTLYSFQTEDEKAIEATCHDNSMGFNALDAGIMSSFAQFYQRTGFLTPKQLNLARRTLKKYSRQLLDASPITPLAIKGQGEKKKSEPIKDRMTVEMWEGKMMVKFAFAKGDPKFKECLANVKTLDGRRWNPEKKAWTVPRNLMSLKALMHWGFELSAELKEWHDRLIIDIESLEPIKPKLREGMELHPFQELGIAYAEKAGGRAIIGDEMGLGKTVQALGYLSLHHPDAFPALVVCPANVKYNWQREIKKWLPDHIKVRVLSGRLNGELDSEDFIDEFHNDLMDTIIICNYDILSNKTEEVKKGGKLVREEVRGTGWGDFLTNVHMVSVIYDEFHMLKESKTLRTKACKRLAKNADNVLMLSGTPVINRPVEFFNGIELVNPEVFSGWWYYVHKFCAAYHDGYGLNTSGHSNTDELHQILTSTCLSYDSIIYSKEGPIKIGEIVHAKTKTEVLSFNHQTSKIQWKPIKTYSSRIAPDRMLRIVHESGELCCTPDHQIWVQERGYIRAEEIKTGVHLLVVPQESSENSWQQEDYCDLLFCQMCSKSSGFNRNSNRENEKEEMGSLSKFIKNKKMPSMQKDHVKKGYGYPERQSLGGKEILFHQLQYEMAQHPSIKEKSFGEKTSRIKIARSQKNSDSSFNSRKKKTSRSFKGKKNIKGNTQKNGSGSKEKMGQRKSGWKNSKILENFTMGISTPQRTRLARRMVRIQSNEEKTNRSIQEGGNLLFSGRYSKPTFEACYRSRWADSQFSNPKIQRCLERKNIEISRVESVEVYQSRNRQQYSKNSPKDYVYDIQVEGNHNFFANRCLVHNCMIRRVKKDVYDQLPEKNRTVVPLPMADRQDYEDAVKELREFLDHKYSSGAALVEIEKLKQMAVKAKMESAIEWIRDFLDSGEKLILFADHRFVVDELMAKFKDVAVKIDGGTPAGSRMDIVDAFQKDDKVRLFIGTKAAKEGLTLDVASNVAFMELWWEPGSHSQAEDRCYGRLSNPHGANIWYLVAMETIEEDIAQLLDKKRVVVGSILDGKPIDAPSILTELIEAVKNK